MSDELFYDTEIAPTLLAISKLCKERGFAFVAHVQWDADNTGRTEQAPHGFWPQTRLVQYAARAQGNADLLIMAMKRDAAEHGHASFALTMLGGS